MNKGRYLINGVQEVNKNIEEIKHFSSYGLIDIPIYRYLVKWLLMLII